MEGFSGALDDILVSIYRNVLRLEKQMLKRSRQTTLSVSEVHLILCLGDAKGDGKGIRAQAERGHIFFAENFSGMDSSAHVYPSQTACTDCFRLSTIN